ncbi:hypothetical protein BH24GEM1_BH24GEM1_22830 [soil metagenome]
MAQRERLLDEMRLVIDEADDGAPIRAAAGRGRDSMVGCWIPACSVRPDGLGCGEAGRTQPG